MAEMLLCQGILPRCGSSHYYDVQCAQNTRICRPQVFVKVIELQSGRWGSASLVLSP